MRFFALSKVKNDISSGALGERETLQYLIAWFVVFCLASFPSSGEVVSVVAARVFWVVVSVVNLWGIKSCYSANGGAGGSHFVGRFLSLGWVLGIRGLVVLIPAFFVLCTLLGMLVGAAGLLKGVGVEVVAEYALFSSLVVYVAWFYSRLCMILRGLRITV